MSWNGGFLRFRALCGLPDLGSRERLGWLTLRFTLRCRSGPFAALGVLGGSVVGPAVDAGGVGVGSDVTGPVASGVGGLGVEASVVRGRAHEPPQGQRDWGTSVRPVRHEVVVVSRLSAEYHTR